MKRISILCIALLGLMMVVACGGSSDDGGNHTIDPPTPDNPKTYSQSVTMEAKDGDVTVTLSNLQSSVSNIANGCSWLTVTKQTYTSGAPSLLLHASENTETVERSCEVMITASNGDKVKLTVTQKAADSQEEDKTGIDDTHESETDQPAYAPSI